MEDLKGTQVREYVETAKEFCAFIEHAGSARPTELFETLQKLLPQIYAKTSQIRKPKYCFEDEPQKFVQENEYALVHDRLQGAIEKFNGIGSIKQSNKALGMDILSFSLAEAITDIYKELKDFYKLYEVGLSQAINDSVWGCRESFEKQWGIQLIETLQSIHQLMYGHKLTTNQLEFEEESIEAEELDEGWFSEEDDIPNEEE